MIRPTALSISIVMLLLLTVSSQADASLRGGENDSQNRFWLSAVWGGMTSSQLVRDIPVSFWSVQVNAPLVEPLGLSAHLRFDSPVFGDPNQAMSLLIHPGHTDYGIGFALQPPGLPVAAEYHHVSGHAVAALYEAQSNHFEDVVSDGGSSNFGSIALFLESDTVLRLGYGGLTNDANTAPVLLGFDGVLLNSRTSWGPFAAFNTALPRVLGLVGHAGVMYVHDTKMRSRFSGEYLNWGFSLARPLSRRTQVGFSYVGDNGTPGVKQANTMVSAFVRLSWGLSQ